MDSIDSVAASRQRVVGFADVVRIPLRRWRLVAGTTLALTLGMLAYLLIFPATYTATATVVLRPVVTDPFTATSGTDKLVNMTAENGIALGNDVIDSTSKKLNRDPEDVRDALTTEVPTGGQVLRFLYADDAEDDAVTGANTAAETYLTVRKALYEQQQETLIKSYDETIESVTSERKTAQKQLSSSDSSAKTEAILNEVAALNDQIAQLANARAKVVSADLTPGSITAAARAPVPSSHDAAPLFLAGALLGGLLLGMIAAHVMEAADRRVRTGDQATDLTGVPGLGSVRTAARGKEEAAAADARYVSLAVLKAVDNRTDRPLVVLSARADEGRSVLSANLAVALAEGGHDVALAAPAETQEEIKRVLFAAQKRMPPRPRTAPKTNGARQQTGSFPNPRTADPAATMYIPTVGSRAPGAAPVSAQPTAAPVSGINPSATTVPFTGAMAAAAQLGTMPMNGQVSAAPVSGAGGTGRDGSPLVVLIGGGVVRLCPLGEQPDFGLVVVDAPPSDIDERGVRAAQAGVAVLVVARDHTRTSELSRLVDRLRSSGAQTVGFVLTGGRGA